MVMVVFIIHFLLVVSRDIIILILLHTSRGEHLPRVGGKPPPVKQAVKLGFWILLGHFEILLDILGF